MMNTMKLRQRAQSRGITSLYHFTPLPNLESILHNGLLSRQTLDQHQAPYLYTDGWRNDGRLDAVSLSIHDINRAMFASKVKTSRCSWVILEVDASVLWTHPCRFCWTNAASSQIVNHRGFLGGPWAFDQMFTDTELSAIDPRSSRGVRQTPLHTPTRNDAEVQVLAPITPDMIRDVTLTRHEDRHIVEAITQGARRVLPIEVVPEVLSL